MGYHSLGLVAQRLVNSLPHWTGWHTIIGTTGQMRPPPSPDPVLIPLQKHISFTSRKKSNMGALQVEKIQRTMEELSYITSVLSPQFSIMSIPPLFLVRSDEVEGLGMWFYWGLLRKVWSKRRRPSPITACASFLSPLNVKELVVLGLGLSIPCPYHRFPLLEPIQPSWLLILNYFPYPPLHAPQRSHRRTFGVCSMPHGN